jgi:hypothetical protein
MAEQKATLSWVDGITPWLLVTFAALAGLGAVLRACFATNTRLLEGIDHTTLFYLGVAGALLLLRQVKSVSFGSYKLEMLERVREKQAQQEDQIEEFRLTLPLLLPEKEQKHLTNLFRGQTGDYRGNGALRAELGRLKYLGLIEIRPGQHIRYMADGLSFDLAIYVKLTDLGKRWAIRIQQLERADAGPGENGKGVEENA